MSRTVTTIKELDELPIKTLIQEYDGFLSVKINKFYWHLCIDGAGSRSGAFIDLPATVLYDPSEEKELK